MNVNLTPRLESWVRKRVESGLYSNVSEVICAALRLLDRQERKTDLESEVRKGFRQIQRNQVVRYDIVAVKKIARANAKAGRKVKSVVTP